MPAKRYLLLVVSVTILSVASTQSVAQIVWQKHPSNPVLSGTPGSWDQDFAAVSSVLFEGGVYKAWYWSNGGFGYATSADGLAWSKHASNPVLVGGPPGSWDEFEPAQATVVNVTGTYHMWYSAVDSSGTNRIGHATSPDGISWTKDPANPVLDLGPPGSLDSQEVIHPEVIFRNGTFHMWYNGVHNGQRILYAHSPDGVVWERFTAYPALDLGTPGQWDDEQLFGMSVVYADNAFRMWYTAWNQAFEFGIGYAVSPDGKTWWKDSMHNPVLGPGNSGSWDYPFVGFVTVLFTGSQYKMWYPGGNIIGDPFKVDTGYATSNITITAVGSGGDGPLSYTLDQNYPNPFNPQTTIRFDLPEPLRVSLRIYDVSARLVRELIDGELKSAGPHTIQWDGRDNGQRPVASGVYFYRLEAGDFAQTKQMTLIK